MSHRYPAGLLRALLLAVPLVGSHTPVVQAEVYRWVDDTGRVHYGDRAPANADADRVEPRVDAPSGAAPAPRVDRTRLLEAIEFERNARARAARERREQAAEARARCEKLRDLLAQYERANLIYREGAGGQREYLDDEQRAEAMGRLRAEVRKRCR